VRRASASSERKQSRPRERRPVPGSETSTNSLLELQTVKTGVPVSARATSSGSSARESDAPWGPGARVAAAARAGRGAVRWEARRERWWRRKEEAAARGLGGGAAEVGEGVGSVIRVAASGREERVEAESSGGIGRVACCSARGNSVVAWGDTRRRVGRRRRRGAAGRGEDSVEPKTLRRGLRGPVG